MAREWRAPSSSPPQAPEPPWRRGARSTPPRTQLSRDAIVEAALRVVAREGVDRASMRLVAEELSTGAASLYWHVRNREELLHLMIDAVAGEVPLPDPEPARWQEQLKALGRDMRATMLRHGDIAKATMGRIPLGPNTIRISEWMIALLRAGGVPDRTIALAIDLLSLYIGAHAMESSAGFVSPTGEEAPIESFIEMYRAYFRSLPPASFPNTVELADLLVDADADERFDFGLDLLIAGLAASVPTRARG